MNKNEILSAVNSVLALTPVRVNGTNCFVIPGDVIDGVQTYYKLSVSALLSKDTKAAKAFNYEAAVAEYKAYEAYKTLEAQEKANKPTKEVKNIEAQARRDALDNAIRALPAFESKTATEIMAMLPEGSAPTVMAVGSSATRLVNAGEMTVEVIERKKYYTKA